MMELLQKHKKVILIIVVAIVLVILYKKFGWKIGRFFGGSVGNPMPEGQEISDSAKVELQSLSKLIYNDIYDTSIWGHDYDPYNSLKAKYDEEIIFAAKYYKNSLADGNSMAADIYTQYYTTSDDALNLRLKLKELGQD